MRPIPADLKRLRGSARGDRLPRSRPQPAAGAPPADPTWPGPLRARYDALVRQMGASATQADGSVLWLTALALVEVDEHSATLENEGSTYISGKRGMRRPNPAVRLRDAAWRRALMGLRALGLSPTDRDKVPVVAAPVFDLGRYQ